MNIEEIRKAKFAELTSQIGNTSHKYCSNKDCPSHQVDLKNGQLNKAEYIFCQTKSFSGHRRWFWECIECRKVKIEIVEE